MYNYFSYEKQRLKKLQKEEETLKVKDLLDKRTSILSN